MVDDELLEKAQEIFGNLVIEVEGQAIINGGAIDISVDNGQSTAKGIVLKFENGNRVRFRTSEWAYIERVSPLEI